MDKDGLILELINDNLINIGLLNEFIQANMSERVVSREVCKDILESNKWEKMILEEIRDKLVLSTQ